MKQSPFLISALVVAASTTLAVHLALDPEPFASESSVLVAAGSLLFSLITTAGLLLSRGLWSRRLGIGLVSGHLALGLVLELGPWAVAAMASSALALAGLTGPWLKGWLRQRPAADGPGARPVLLLLAVLALIPGVALSAPDDLTPSHYALAATSVVGAWTYTRAMVSGLWSLRVVVLPFGILAATASPAWGGAYLGAHVLAVTYLAWSGESKRAASPLLDRVYGPRSPRPLDKRVEETQ